VAVPAHSRQNEQEVKTHVFQLLVKRDSHPVNPCTPYGHIFHMAPPHLEVLVQDISTCTQVSIADKNQRSYPIILRPTGQVPLYSSCLNNHGDWPVVV